MANRISFKQIGQNLLLTIDGETKTKKVEDKEERNKIVADVKDLIEKPTKAKEIKLVKLFSANETKAKKEVEDKKAAVKAVEKQVKKESKGTKKGLIASVVDSVKEIVSGKSEAELKDLEDKKKQEKVKQESAPKAQRSSYGRRGEY